MNKWAHLPYLMWTYTLDRVYVHAKKLPSLSSAPGWTREWEFVSSKRMESSNALAPPL